METYNICAKDSKWRNPYRPGIDGGYMECLSYYLAYLQKQISENTSFLSKLYDLAAYELVCDCTNKYCHKLFIQKLIDRLVAYENKHLDREFNDVTILEDADRIWWMSQGVKELVIEWGNTVKHEMSSTAQDNTCVITNYHTFKEYRTLYLDPLLKWKFPRYRQAIGESI